MILTSCQGSFSAILDLTPSSKPPASPEYGQAWLDSSTNPPTIKIWNGSAWVDQLEEAVEDMDKRFQGITSSLSQAQKDILKQAGLIDNQGKLIAGNSATIESHTETLSNHSAQIKANEDAISLKVDTQTYTKDQSTINASIANNLTAAKGYTDTQINVVNTSLETATAAIKVLQNQITSKVEQTDIDKAVTEVKLYADNAAETVLNTATEQINSVRSEIIQDINSITSRVSSTESSITSINGVVSSLSNRISSAELKITEDAITQVVSKSFATKDSVSGKVDQTSIISSINQSAETIKILASKIELTGKVTFSMLDSAAQSKITTAQSTADSAKTAATNAQNTANTVKSTVDSNKANWDKGITAYNWTNSYGTRTNNLYAMVTKWTDNAVSTTTQINGGWIKTNTITADKIAVGDFTNYVADPGFENDVYPIKQYFSFVTNIKHTGKKSVKISGNPTGWPVLEVSKWFHVTNGDKIFVGWWAYRGKRNSKWWSQYRH